MTLESLHQRHPQFQLLRKGKAGRHHADHGREHAAHPHSAADHGRILSKPPFPVAVVQDGDGSSAGRLVRGRKIPSEHRFLPDKIERVGAYFRYIQPLRKAARVAEDLRYSVNDGHIVEGL